VLSEMRIGDNDKDSVYYMNNFQRCDVYVKISECYLADEDIVRAEGILQKAGGLIDLIPNPEQNLSLILRYKLTYARVLDANQKFLQASGKYLELSHAGSQGDMVDNVDLLLMLVKASTCAILAPICNQRRRILGQIFEDERLLQEKNSNYFKDLIPILENICKNRIINRDNDLINFENSMPDHHKTIMIDGLTILQRSVVEHNIFAVSQLYSSIYFTQLERFINIPPRHAEMIVTEMIADGRIYGSIDQVKGILYFDINQSALVDWDGAISGFCSRLNDIVDTIEQEI